MKQQALNLGKGEVDSSILFGSTIFPRFSDNPGTCSFGHLNQAAGQIPLAIPLVKNAEGVL